MSLDAMTWVFKQSPYMGVERLIHPAIADVVNDGHDNQFWMSQGRLASKANCSRKAVNSAIGKMIEAGHLVLISTGSGQQPNMYQMVLGVTTGDTSDGGVGVTTGDTSCNHRLQQTVATPYSNNSIEPNTSEKIRRSPYSAEFEVLWKLYPRRENKKGTWDKFQATVKRGESPFDLIAAVENYATKVKAEGTEQRYILLGATFFGPSERWQDYAPGEIEPAWVPEDNDLAWAEVWDGWFDNGHWLDNGGNKITEWAPLHSTAPKHPDGGITSADGRRYRIDGDGNRAWIAPSAP